MTRPDAGPPNAAVASGARPRAGRVALVAALVPAVWVPLVAATERVPMFLVLAPVSALLWWWAAFWLATIAEPRARLQAALGFGLVSPLAGIGLMAAPTTCVPCCSMAWFAVPGAAMLMLAQPLWFFPFGLGMGLVAFLLVRPTPRPPG